jgi:hypothetical protein
MDKGTIYDKWNTQEPEITDPYSQKRRSFLENVFNSPSFNQLSDQEISSFFSAADRIKTLGQLSSDHIAIIKTALKEMDVQDDNWESY